MNGEFDTTYHEHISFFSANSMKTLAQRAGLVLTDIEITPIHGDSYVFVLKHPCAEIKNTEINYCYMKAMRKTICKNDA